MNQKTKLIALTGLFAALSYVVFTFLQFKIYIGPADATSIHLGNAVCVLGALLLGGLYGGLGGAIGMTIGDLMDPVYIVYAPKTFVLKLCIGLITGFIAHKIGKISTTTNQKRVVTFTLLSAIGGLLFNVIFDPLVGYFYKIAILGRPAAEVTFAINLFATSINAILSTIVAVSIYLALRPILKRTGLFITCGNPIQKELGNEHTGYTEETISNQ
ncbi:MAG: ECF transporter S component [Eubacteriales bacterium]